MCKDNLNGMVHQQPSSSKFAANDLLEIKIERRGKKIADHFNKLRSDISGQGRIDVLV